MRCNRCVAVCAIAAWPIAAAAARAQAWVAPAGSGSVTIAVQSIYNTGHVQTNGDTLPIGESQNHTVYLEADYALTDRISVAAGIPFVFSKFFGPSPPDFPLRPIDACYCWQSGWQDFTFLARSNVLNGAFALTPSVFAGQPSHAYDYQGEAVIGRRLGEIGVGVDAGARLDRISPRLAVQGRFAYTWVEQVLDISANRSRLSGEVLVEVTERFSLRTGVHRQITHGGLRAGNDQPPPEGYPWGEIITAEQFNEHDRLMRDNNWKVGVGASYSWSRVDLFASWLEFVGGSDTHAGRAFTAGLVMRFER